MLFILDFDETIIDIHTYNNWKLSHQKLIEHIRPVFITLINLWIRSGDKVAIATFSKQVKLIKKVLNQVFNGHKFVVCGGMPDKFSDGKNEHIKKICKKLKMEKNQVLYIDNDIINVNLALKENIRSICFNDENTLINELSRIK